MKDLSNSIQDENTDRIQGEYYFRIETRKGDDDETKCRKWVKWQEDNVKSLITASFLPSCPCSLFQALFDSRFFGFFFDALTGNLCFYSSFPNFIVGNLVFGLVSQKCCYSGFFEDFGAIVLNDVGAGSVDVFYFTRPDDILDDNTAKQVCCYGSQNCDKFYSVRPSQDCTGYRVLRRSK